MAKRRERRVPPSSDRREDGAEGSKRTFRRGGDSASSPQINTVVFLIVVIVPAIAVLVYRIKYAPRTNRLPSSYVHQQGLVKADVNYQEILTVSVFSGTKQNIVNIYSVSGYCLMSKVLENTSGPLDVIV